MSFFDRSMHIAVRDFPANNGRPDRKAVFWRERNFVPERIWRPWDNAKALAFVLSVIAGLVAWFFLYDSASYPFLTAVGAALFAYWLLLLNDSRGARYKELKEKQTIVYTAGDKSSRVGMFTSVRSVHVERDRDGIIRLIVKFPPHIIHEDSGSNWAAFERSRIVNFALEEHDPEAPNAQGLPSPDLIYLDHGDGETTLIANHFTHRADMRKLRATLYRLFVATNWQELLPPAPGTPRAPSTARRATAAPQPASTAEENAYQAGMLPDVAQKDDDVI